ncbi:MAG: TolC family protein [Flavobacteriales bacterium]|nr:TolC family protein [Flavobacteriales bacterium]
MRLGQNYIKYSLILLTTILLGTKTEGQDLNLTQEVLYVKLEDVLEITGTKSLIIDEYKQRLKIAKAEKKIADQWWLPSIYGGITKHSLNGAVMNADGAIYNNINQSNAWAGLGASAEWDLSKALFLTKSSKQKLQALKQISTAEKNKAVLKAVYTFLDMQAEHSKELAIADLLVNKAEDITKQISIQVELGIRYKSELYLSQARLGHFKIQRLEANRKYRIKAAELANLLNADANVRVESADHSVTGVAIIDDTQNSPPLLLAKQRPEFKGLEMEINSLRTGKRAITTGMWLPDVKLNTYQSMFGGNISNSSPTNLLNMGIVWKIPLANLIGKGEIKKHNGLIGLHENKLKQFQNLAIQEAVNAREQSKISAQMMKISDEALQVAAQAMLQSIERQMMGTAQPFEVFQAQEYYLQAKLDYILAVTSFNKAQYSMYIALGNNF